jgi:mono/diheme cytochrome c family protein
MSQRAKIAGAMLVIASAAAALLISTLRSGFSAQEEPTALEHVLARAMRSYAVPRDLRDRRNPVALKPEVLAEARAHFADHCATCHGNDGKGQTAIGRNLYPKAPDMTLSETQSQSDGALFATIENGVRLTGMPGWGNGTAESAYGSWTLVHFIRHLPKLSESELAEMQALNPKSPDEWQQQQQEKRFLAGGDVERTPSPKPSTHHH